MLYLTENDKLIINNCYRNFLQSLKEDLLKYSIKDSLDCYAIIVKLLKDGQFSYLGEMRYSSSFAYLHLPDIIKGSQVMYGVGCCRHVNLLTYDIMKILGFTPNLLYVNVDETNNWYKSTPNTANHVVITLKDNDNEYLLDAYNNFIFKIVNNTLEPVNLKEPANIPMPKYPDNNIKEIGLILKKYYKLHELAIDNIYNYDY